MDERPFLLEQSALLVSRLERLSADSVWAHRASGCRGALLKMIEQIEASPAGPAPSSQAPDWDRLAFLVDWGYELLEKAAREMADLTPALEAHQRFPLPETGRGDRSKSIKELNRMNRMDELHSFRAEKDAFFASHPQSPLTREQKSQFKGLDYFPENPDLRLEAVVDAFPDPADIEMQTSTGDVQSYRRFGKFRFEVDGQPAELVIYYNESGYFLPFVDALAGKETYPAGRYLEPEPLPGGKFLVDFNLAYNPYCAYNDRWSCPLTPFENRLKVPIRAGEKMPAGDWAEHA